MQKGFVQVPILIAIVITIAFSGGAFATYELTKQRINTVPQGVVTKSNGSKEPVTVFTGNTTSTSIVAENKANTQESRDQTIEKEIPLISSLQKQIADLKKKIDKQDELESWGETPQTRVTILPSGATAEIDINGNIVKILNQNNQISTTDEKPLTNAEISNKITPAIVHIKTFTTDSEGDGTGIIFESNGWILTAAHVVQGFSQVQIILGNGNVYTGRVVGRDDYNDVAIVKVEISNLNNVALGNSDALSLGDKILVYGHPLGLPGVVVSSGILGGKQVASNFTYLQTDAKTQPGSSGGAWVNEKGEVVGLHVAGIGPKIQGIKVDVGLNFAVPINFVKSLIPKLKIGESVIDYLSQPKPTNGSAVEIRQAVITAVNLNPDLNCTSFGFTSKDLYACTLYKGYKNNYSWQIVDIYSENILPTVDNSLSVAAPPLGSTIQIPKSITVAVSFNPDLTCKQLSFTGDYLDKCNLYKNSRSSYNWEITD